MAGNGSGDSWAVVAELTAIAGVDPWPLTLRELIAASKAKRMNEWDHTAETLAMMASTHTGRHYGRDMFHPLRQSPQSIVHLDDPAAEYERLMKEQQR